MIIGKVQCPISPFLTVKSNNIYGVSPGPISFNSNSEWTFVPTMQGKVENAEKCLIDMNREFADRSLSNGG